MPSDACVYFWECPGVRHPSQTKAGGLLRFLLLRIDAVREQQLYLGAKVAGFLNRTVGGASQLLGVLLKAMAGLL
jgi:hypothetical protein